MVLALSFHLNILNNMYGAWGSNYPLIFTRRGLISLEKDLLFLKIEIYFFKKEITFLRKEILKLA